MCVATSTPSDDGTDGNFYCINSGTIGGTTGACTCTCASGYSGTNCETADACSATSTLSDDGTDGNFYCINSGTIGGTTGACTCNCPAGYSGVSCQTADPCAATATPSDDGTDGNFYCINGGTIGGTTAACTCTCASGYGGTNCQTVGGCTATATPSDDGTDGNFYCINGGTIGGTTGACTCTCASGYSGTNCETADACSATSILSDDGTDGNFYCINSGTIGGTTGACTCNCPAGYSGANCETITVYCDPNPCLYGICNSALGAYTCNCVAGYEGTNCDHEVNECSLSRIAPEDWNQVGTVISGPSSIQFGSYVIMNYDGSVVAFGAPLAQDPSLPDFEGEGYVSVYQLVGTVWTQMGSNIYGDDGAFAGAVALSDDGLTVAVGAHLDGYNGGGCGYGCGNVRIYTYDGSSWNQKGQDLEGFHSEYLGHAVSLNNDGSRVAIGAPNFNSNQKGRAVMYEYGGSSWDLLGFTTGFEMMGEANGDDFGFSIKMNSVGDRVIVGSHLNDDNGNSAGQVRVYKYTTSWSQVGLDLNGQTGNDWFGHDVCMSADGLTIAVGSHKRGAAMEGTVQVFVDQGGTWTQRGLDIIGVPDNHGGQQTTGQGFSLSLSDDGTRLAVGAPFFGSTNDGYVKVYEFFDGDWVQLGLKISGASDVRLGHDVALSGDGLRVTVGTFSQDNVVVYDYQVCQNAGTCTDGVDSFTCNCLAGYTGTNCETDIDECNPDPCQNYAQCTQTTDGVTLAPNSYHCACDQGYSGTHCETADACTASAVSDHDGTTGELYCINGVVEGITGACTCNCNPGYSDPGCDVADFCIAHGCLNSGTCVNGVGSYTCDCSTAPGWTGTLCADSIDDCGAHACVNNGVCIDGHQGYTCNCLAGYEGTYCEHEIDECDPNPCVGGICTDLVNDYSCDCANSTTDKNCVPLPPPPPLRLRAVPADIGTASLLVMAGVVVVFGVFGTYKLSAGDKILRFMQTGKTPRSESLFVMAGRRRKKKRIDRYNIKKP